MDFKPQTSKEFIFYFKRILKKIVPQGFLKLYFSLFPFIGNVIFGKPSKKLKVIGITGTDGKSSTVILLARILKQAGYKVGFFSSVMFSTGKTEEQNLLKMTMPGRFFIQKFLATLVKHQADFAIIEVTSEGIKQKRHLYIDFDLVLCTNINPEHIESHGGFNQYKCAKAELFKKLKSNKCQKETISVVNGDNSETKKLLQYQASKKITFGFNKGNLVKGEINHLSLNKTSVKISTDKETISIVLNYGGPFLVENVLAAVAASYSLGVSLNLAKKALEKSFIIPGRFEIVTQHPFIIVDYAHTVDAVNKILSFVRKNWQGKIIHVFGAAGGGRDKWKRKELAKLSEQHANYSIVTEENSFDEPIKNIIAEITKGFSKQHSYQTFTKRRDALAKSISLSDKDTLILLTGKGSETVIAGPFGRKVKYNEKTTVWELLNSPKN